MIQFGVNNIYVNAITHRSIEGWGIVNMPYSDYGRLDEFCKENAIVISRCYPYLVDWSETIHMSVILQGTNTETQMLLKLMFS